MRQSLVWKNLSILSTLLATSIVLAGCGDSDDDEGQTTPNPCKNVSNSCETLGERMCSTDGASVLVCQADTNGCSVWSTERSCGQHAACVDGDCACNDECDTTGAQRCTEDVLETCSSDAIGCEYWETTTDCAATQQTCVESGGQAQCEGGCTSSCTTEGDLRCDADLLQVCNSNADGCLYWETSEDCTANVPAQECDDSGATPACVSTCSDSCPAENDVHCNGDSIETCTMGANGCLAWETTTDCSANAPAQTCDESGGTPQCADACQDACPAEDDLQCNGDNIETCTMGANGCLAWETTTDCSANTPAQTCDDSGATPVCADTCQDACPTENDVQCNGDIIETCTVGTNGCLAWETTTDCSTNTPAQTCDDSGATPVCADTCQDACPTENDVQCNGDIIETCTVGANGCLAWETTTDCSANSPAQTCDDSGAAPVCADPPSIGTCAAPEVIAALPFQVAGVDFPNDYTNDHNFTSSTDCTTANGSDAIFQLTMTGGQTIRLQEFTSFDAVIRVLDVCDEATATCLASEDTDEDFMFTAPADGDYFIVLESYSASPSSVAWHFMVQEVLPETDCANNIDDDGDGDTDCEDSDCFGAVGACEVETGYCDDGLDNDNDGQSDCDDTDCAADPICAVAQGVFEEYTSSNLSDLAGCTLVFTPNASNPNGYDQSGSCACLPEWLVTPGSGTVTTTLSLNDDAATEYTLSEMPAFTFYQNDYTSLFVGSNGFITFGSDDTGASSSTTTFFSHPRIAGFDDDLDPDNGASGTITVDESSTETAVTFDGVEHYNTSDVSAFQILMAADGTISLYYSQIGDPDDGFAGICNGASTGTLPSGTDLLNVPMAPQTAGQLLISEVHYNDANASAEGVGEFIEVHNPTGEELDLSCCTLGDNSGVFDIPDGTMVAPSGYIVFVRNADQAANGGITGGVQYGDDIQLSNSDPENISIVCGGVDIDVLPFDMESNWPGGADGASMQLSSLAMNASQNDDPVVWCTSTDAYGSGDLGTPGVANSDCGATAYLSEDFETDPSWTVVGNWEWGTPSYSSGPSACAGGQGCYGTTMDGTYTSSMNFDTCYVEAPAMDMSAATGFITMDFDMWLETENNYDYGLVQVSTDGGTTWTALAMQSPAYNDPDGWMGALATNWVPASADLSTLAGQSDVRIRWALDTDVSGNRAGFYIDNATIVGF